MTCRARLTVAASIIATAALTGCGFKSDDPEFQEAARWHSAFRNSNPELAQQLAEECAAEINPGWNRDDTLKLVSCIRNKAEALG